MLFPIWLEDGYSWDLRRIPFIIAILYAGPKNAVLLLSFVLFTRFIISGGSGGLYITFITFTILAIIISLVSRYFLKMPLYQKLLMSGLLAVLSNQIAFFISTNFTDMTFSSNMWIQYFIVNLVGILMATLLVEVIRLNSHLLEKLMKAEKLEVVSHLAASISHEVRNPLTTCKGFLQLSYQEETAPHIKQYLGTAIQELDRASNIINDYLTFAKPVPEEVEKIFICQEVQNVVNILTPLANMNDVQLLVNLEAQKQSFILGERKKLQQSLINIVKNGIESMQKGGKLEITTAYEYPMVRIHIRDEGIGMTRHQMNRLGEPYFTTKENGTGLGMMVSYSLIRGMGGQINVDSDYGNWTSFLIEFPVVQ
ncbi:MAG: ATP-binding protein [Paenisporosarcina sp.]